jgi:hypothetical protein
MALRHLLRGAAPVAVAALTLGSGLTAAQAAAAPAWRLVKVYGASAGSPFLEGLSAARATDAWVSGTAIQVTTQALFIDRWNGTSWTRLAAPRAFTVPAPGIESDGVIGSSSRADMWTFPNIVNGSTSVQYALHWNGAAWKSFRLLGTIPFAGILSTAVFGPTNAWAFGQAPVKHPSGGFGAPYAVRFNGRAWRRVPMPGTAALGLSALSASNIWAFGPTARTAGLLNQVMIGMHWNGRSWTTLTVPRYKVSGKLAVVQSMIALGRSSVWVAESLPANRCGCQPMPLGIILAHWNGRSWREVVRDGSDAFQGGLVADGSGGLWLQSFSARSPMIEELLHYSGGRLSRVREPSVAGFATFNFQMALIPGTTSLWAVAGLGPNSSGPPEGAIFKRGA